MTDEIRCDILIADGSAGGVAAALSAASAGANVVLLEETDWLGGQLTTQGVCTPDEQTHIETFGGTARYYAFRNAARAHYRDTYTLSEAARERAAFNPGSCWVSRTSWEPKVGVSLLQAMLRPLEEAGRLHIFYRTRVVAIEMHPHPQHADRIDTVTARQEPSLDGELPDGSPNGRDLRFRPRFVLDATDLGDLLPLCGIEGEDWVVGAEAQSETGEPDAPPVPHPEWVQPFTFPFALDWSPETAETNVIAPPPDYETLKVEQNYPKLLHGAITGLFAGAMPWWRYRRVLAAENFVDPRIPTDLAMINTGGNDYYGGNIIGALAGSPDDVQATLARARRASLGYVYYLQTECPREEKAERGEKERQEGETVHSVPVQGYPEFRLRKDIFDTPDGCAIQPYIREARRIKALRPILEQEIVVKSFRGEVCRGDRSRAAFMPDSVGVGHYALDIHQNGHGEPNAYVATRPFQIRLGALIPRRLENLLPACKNLGVTHLTNGAYRLHPIEWNIGESAGLLAAFCLQSGHTPRSIIRRALSGNADVLQAFQAQLLANGVPLYWLIDVPLGHPAFAAVQKLALTGAKVGSETDLRFRPDDPMEPELWQEWRQYISPSATAPETFTGIRAEAALALYPD